MHLAIHGTATDMQARCGGADIPAARLKRTPHRVPLRAAQYAQQGEKSANTENRTDRRDGVQSWQWAVGLAVIVLTTIFAYLATHLK